MKIVIQSDFVKAGQNIKHGDIVRLISEGEYRELTNPEGKKRKVLQFEMKMPNKEIKTYTMNVTTQKNLINEWGDDSKSWIEKDLKAWVLKQQAFGKITDVLILTPVQWNEPDKPGTPEVKDEDIPVVEDEVDTK